jgi:hypothetical protein
MALRATLSIVIDNKRLHFIDVHKRPHSSFPKQIFIMSTEYGMSFGAPPEKRTFLEMMMAKADSKEHEKTQEMLDAAQRAMACAPGKFDPNEYPWVEEGAIGLELRPGNDLAVVARCFIPKKRTITAYGGIRTPISRQLTIRSHAFRIPGTWDVLDAYASRQGLLDTPHVTSTRNLGAFINSTVDTAGLEHRERANVVPLWSGPPECMAYFVTTQDIQPGEEILWVYHWTKNANVSS